ncbi:DUF4105 domain-containing protein [Myxococcota bacterium]|nr:DUF4105 domain-containing protein [Myxococcota bacterium]MBU1536128.1 DUF4105 domain-containing protein [Myxococcota bacterium]
MTLIALLLTLLTPAQIPPDSDHPEAWVVIVDPGSEIFTRFGHSAFLIRDPNGDETIYDFGVFDFDASFALRFIKGKAKYYLDKRPLPEFMNTYETEKRSIRGHLLNLSPAKVKELRNILESLYDSEERYYRYHHFSNNCSTQMLFILSRLFKGDVQYSLEKIPIVPWRTNLGSVLGEYSLLNWGLRLVLSSELDAQRNAWTGSFLPYLLERSLLAVQVSEDPFAKKVPLIAKSVTFYQGINHTQSSSKPWWFYVFTLLFGLILLLPLVLHKKPFFLRLAFFTWGLFSLMIFSALLFLHLHLDICAYNLNLLAFFPFLLVAALFMGKDRLYQTRSLVLLVIAALFPIMEMVLRLFTIQRSYPFPEWTLAIHLLFILEWTVVILSKKRELRKLVTELEVLSPGEESKAGRETPSPGSGEQAQSIPATEEKEPSSEDSEEKPPPKEPHHGESSPLNTA